MIAFVKRALIWGCDSADPLQFNQRLRLVLIALLGLMLAVSEISVRLFHVSRESDAFQYVVLIAAAPIAIWFVLILARMIYVLRGRSPLDHVGKSQ